MKQNAIVIDLDGTLVDSSHREPYDYKEIKNDKVVRPVYDIMFWVSDYMPKVKVIILSGRNENCRVKTENWLDKNLVNYDEIILNKNAENQVIFKEKAIKQLMKKYNIFYCLDDNPEVVKMFKSLGLKAYSII